jgi:sugar lactone lactonase YvrE
VITLLALAACDTTDPNGDLVEADPCEEPGNICTWLGLPETAGFSGEGTDRSADASTGTFLYLPMDIAFAPDGTAYYPDFNNHRLRRVSVDDVVTTVSGTGFIGLPGEDCWNGCPAFGAPLHHPVSVALDGFDKLWFGAPETSLLTRIDTGADTLTWVGDEVGEPSSVAVHADGTVYFADLGAQLVRRVMPDGAVEAVGPEPSGLMLENGPGLAFDGDVLLIADTGNGLVRSIDLATCASDVSTCVIEDVAGPFGAPRDVAVGLDGAIYVADSEQNCVWVIRDDLVEPFAGQCVGALGGYGGDGGPATAALLAGPFGVTVDPDGLVYVADTGNHVIRRIVPETH